MRSTLFSVLTLASFLTAGPGSAGAPVVIDRELLGQQLQAISLQLANLQRQAGNDANLGAQITALLHQIKALEMQVAGAPAAPSSAPASAGAAPPPPPPIPAPAVPAPGTLPAAPIPAAPPPVLDAPAGEAPEARPPEVPPLPPPLAPAPDSRAAPPGGFPSQAQAIDEPSFQELQSAIQAQSYGRNKLRVLFETARRRHFLVAQGAQILRLFAVGRDRLLALRVLVPRILDRQQIQRLIDLFERASDQRRANQILGIGRGYY